MQHATMISELTPRIQSTTEPAETTATCTQRRCQVTPRIMTHTYQLTQRIEFLGVNATKRRSRLSTQHAAIPGRQRSSPKPCGLFSVHKQDQMPIDLDDDAFMDLLKPKMEPQISVLSTDSGILPQDIRNSSFVDDVIGELTSKGICHTDIIAGETVSVLQESKAPAAAGPSEQPCKRKASSPLALSPYSNDTADNGSISLSGFCKDDVTKRIKNNEASRKSRANRKWKNVMKEQEIAKLEEENQRLSLLLKDFNEVAATCKQWLVQKMENPAEA